MDEIIDKISKELNDNIDDKYREVSYGFFKEPITLLGVRTPVVRRIAKKYFKEIKALGKVKVFSLCTKLFAQKPSEYRTIAIQWASQYKKEFVDADFNILKKWFINHISTWGGCDDFCLNLLSHFIVKYPKYKDVVKSWINSKNRWQRRASAVAFIQGGSWKVHVKYLPDVFEIALALIDDNDDLVQKGSGWMLKVAADTHQKEVFDFIIKHKKRMPRTTLRYAIEKMPPKLKKQAMKKDW